jgi:uncharacterized protein with NAD-binding domain and iron-sulfur cluster
MLELVLAPAKDWIDKSEEEILAATLAELERLFPITIWTGDAPAKLLKFKNCQNAPIGLHRRPRYDRPVVPGSGNSPIH